MKPKSEVNELPRTAGMSRASQIKRYLPVSISTFKRLIAQGRAPKPVRLGRRVTAWNNADIHEWLADPVNYKAEA